MMNGDVLFNVTDLSRREFLRGSATALCSTSLLTQISAQDNIAQPAQALERVKFQIDKNERTEEGRVLIEAQDGGIIFEGRDSRLWTILPENLVERQSVDGMKFVPYSARQLGDRMKLEFGTGYACWEYGPLVICTNAGKNYADWCGELFSRLQSSFEKFWRRDNLPLKEPEFLLPVCLFANRRQFAEYALADADASTAASYGYYSVKTNRTAMFDITADESGAARSIADVNRRMAKSLSNVATMVHEATHQFAFNGGLHQRYADNPLWLMEGMAMFFEVPDLKNKSGWASVGQPNKMRVAVFADWFKSGQRAENSLKTLIQDDTRFLDADTAGAAYAEAWSLTYYLIKRRREEYTVYLKHVAEKPILKYLTPAERILEFEKFFGEDWAQLDDEMVTLLKRIRR